MSNVIDCDPGQTNLWLKAYFEEDVNNNVFPHSNLHVAKVSRFFCGYDDCQECSHIPFYEQNESLVEKLILCRTCQIDPYMLEYFFHEVCSELFHVDDDKKDHERYPFNLSEIEAKNRNDFLLKTSHYDLEAYQKGLKNVVCTRTVNCILYKGANWD